MAFGGGMRFCVGTDFTKVQMAVFLHCLVTKYRYKALSTFSSELAQMLGVQFSSPVSTNGISGGKRSKEETSSEPLAYSFQMAFMFSLLSDNQQKQNHAHNPAPKILHYR